MSVINKMLRDLDQQAASGTAAAAPRPMPAQIMRGTASVPGLVMRSGPPGPGRRAARIAKLLWLSAAVLAAAWFWPRTPSTPSAPTAAIAVAPAASLAITATVVPAAPAVVDSPATVSVTAAPVVPAPAATQSPAPALPGPARAQTVAKANTRPDKVPVPVPASVPVTPVPGVTRPAAPPEAPPLRGEAAAPSALRQTSTFVEPRAAAASWQEAAQEAQRQAQRMWAGGSREAAADILREALVVVQRSHSAEMSGAGSGVVLAMLRDLVRMDMALGQDAPVLALLKRFEGVAVNQPDLWALRGNAGQRLGQHADAVLAYQNALRLRPGEQRWMLGTAVSLAAQGQTSAAAEFAEQARALGAVNPDVLAYLRQAGVPLR